MKIEEMRKEDNYYLVGPFWIIGKSLEEISKGNFQILARKFLVDYEGDYISRVPRSQFLHLHIWKEYQSQFGNVSYNHFPRGRVSWNSEEHKAWINIPEGLNESMILKKIQEEYDIKDDYVVRHTDPTSDNHYTFLLK